VVATLEREARKGDTIALAIRREDVSYPYFGSRLDRRVVFIKGPADVLRSNWLVVAPDSARVAPAGGQRLVDSHGWQLYRLG